MIRTLTAAVAFAALLTTGALAQGGHCGERSENHHAAASPEVRQAIAEFHQQMRGFAETSVLPQLSEWKAQLDESMSPDDLARLNELRAQAADHQNRRVELIREIRAAMREDGRQAVDQYDEQRRALRDEARTMIAETRTLAGNYRPTLEQIGQEARVSAGEWREQFERMRTSWIEAHPDIAKSDAGMFLRVPARLFRHFGPFVDGCGVAVRFMLWNGEAAAADAAQADMQWLPDLE